MAEVTGMRNNALPYPIYGQQFTVTFPMLDADGDLVTGATTPDAERSLNGDTFADCTNESTEIATNSGVYYLTLTATEMTADIVTVIAKSATAGMKTTVITLYPRKLVTVRTGTCADDGSGTADVVLDSGSQAVDDYYNGMIVCVVIDGAASAECRVITDYTGSTKAATVAVGFNTAVDNTDTFTIYIPEGALHGDSLYGDKIYSDTTTIQSDTTSLASDLAEGDFSDILSRLTVTNSQVLIVKSDTSDIRSNLAGLVAAAGILSDINSGIDVIQTTVSDIQSDTNVMVPIISDIQSDTNKLVSDATEVDTSDILSMLTVVRDNVSDIQSDTNVLITKVTEGDWSDILSRLVVTNSQLVVIKSDAAHIESDAVRVLSDTTAIHTLSTKIDSDQASQFVIIEENTSDTESALVKIYSDTTQIFTDTGSIPYLRDALMSFYGSVGATGNDTTHVHLALLPDYGDDEINGYQLTVYNNDLVNFYTVRITDFVASSKLATIAPALPFTPDTSDFYFLLNSAPARDVWDYELSTEGGFVGATDAAADWLVFEGNEILNIRKAQQTAAGTIGDTGNDTTHLHLVGQGHEDDALNNHIIAFYDASSSRYYASVITDWVNATELATLSPALPVTPQNDTDQFWVTTLLYNTSSGTALNSDQDSKLTRVAAAIVEVDTSDIQSLLTKVYSDTTVLTGGAGSLTSDQDSKLTRVANAIVEVDTSDLMSMLTLIRSDTTTLASDLAEGDFSDILSRLTVVASDAAHCESKVVQIYSDTTHIDSDTTHIESDAARIDSATTVIKSQLLIVKSDTSDVRSALVIIASDTLHIESDCAADQIILSDVQSDTNVLITKVTEGDWSDILSRLTVTNSQLVVVKSDVAHIESDAVVIETVTSDIQSDTNVLITKMRGVVLATGTIGATGNTTTVIHIPDTALDSLSDDEIKYYNVVIYDVSLDEYHARSITAWTNTGDLATVSPALPFTPEASVDLYWVLPPWANQFDGDLSDVLSRLVVTNSDAAHIESKVVQIYSDTTIIYSDTTTIQSDTTSLASDLAEGDTSDILSRLTVMQAVLSDVQSDTNFMVPIVSDIQSDTSDIQSKLVVMAAVTSDIQSDTNVLITKVTEGDWSDILSRLVVTNSQLVVVKSDVAHVESDAVRVLSDTTAIHTLSTKIDSDQASQFVIIEENTSDTESALVKIYSDTTAIEGTAGGLSVAQDSKLTAVHSDTTKIDTKTAGLTYTVANQVDVNIESVNGTQVDGSGTDGDPWGPV